MIKTKVKTKFKGLVWIHEKYMDALNEGRSIVIEYNKKFMTISPDDIEKLQPEKSTESFTERFGKERGKRYHLYGFVFTPDEDQAQGEKNAKNKTQEALAQCPSCKAIKMTMTRGRIGWHSTFVEFEHLPKEKCLTCSKKT